MSSMSWTVVGGLAGRHLDLVLPGRHRGARPKPKKRKSPAVFGRPRATFRAQTDMPSPVTWAILCLDVIETAPSISVAPVR